MPTIRVKAKTSVLDDVPLIERRKAICFVAGQSPTVSWTMVDDSGEPFDLTDYLPTVDPPTYPPVQLAANEAVLGQQAAFTTTGTIDDAAAGLVSLQVDGTKVQPAIYEADIAVVDPATGAPGPINRVTLYIEPSAFGNNPQGGPPTRQRVRMHLRDSSASENRLLDQVMFDDAEIAEAIAQALRIWNSTPPPVASIDTTGAPPMIMGGILNGIEAILWKFAGYWYAKNRLTVSAGGVTVEDMNKDQLCLQLHQQKLADYQAWVQKVKVTINMQMGVGIFSSPYGLRGWTGLSYY